MNIQLFLKVSPYFNPRIAKDKKSRIIPSWDKNSHIYVIVDAISLYNVLHPSPRNDAMNALNVLFDHWIVKFGIPDILVSDNRNICINNNFTHFCLVYNVQFKPSTLYALWSIGLVENSYRQLKRFLRTVVDTLYNTQSINIKTFLNAWNSQVRTNMGLSPYEIVFE